MYSYVTIAKDNQLFSCIYRFLFCIKVMSCVSSPFLLYLSKRTQIHSRGFQWSSLIISSNLAFYFICWTKLIAGHEEPDMSSPPNPKSVLTFFSSWFIMLYFLIQVLSKLALMTAVCYPVNLMELWVWILYCAPEATELKCLAPLRCWYSGYIGMYTNDWILFF
jgi:hypothetical protein